MAATVLERPAIVDGYIVSKRAVRVRGYEFDVPAADVKEFRLALAALNKIRARIVLEAAGHRKQLSDDLSAEGSASAAAPEAQPKKSLSEGTK